MMQRIAYLAVKYISSILTTIKSFKNEPRCSVSCCLEILQLVTDAHGDATDIIDEQEATKVLNDEEKGLGDYAGEMNIQAEGKKLRRPYHQMKTTQKTP